MNSLDLGKVSTSLTPKERAKLVINLQLKGLSEVSKEEVDRYLDGELLKRKEISTQADISLVVSACPTSEAKEYNFYINLKQAVWHDIADKICNNLTRLDILRGDIAALNYVISISPLIQHCIDELERTPVVVTKKEYEEGVRQIKEHERSSVLQLEGRFNLAEEEAYNRLISDGLIEDNDDYLDGYLDFMENHGKTEEELLTEKLEEVKEGIEEYKKEKERFGGEEPPFAYYKEYADLSEDDLKIKVKENYKENFVLPSEEEYQQWLKIVKEEKERLVQATKEGKLIAKDDGVEAGSYYDWSDRRQRFAGEAGGKEKGWHPLREDCMEIGYSDGKVTSGGQAKDGDWHQIVVATEFSESLGGLGNPEAIKRRTDSVIELLQTILPLKVVNKDLKNKQIALKISRPEFEEMITSYVSQATKLIKNTINCIAVIKEIEKEHFDGMSLFSEKPTDSDFSPDKAKESIHNTVEYHNSRIQGAIKLFNRTALGFWDFELENMEQYLLNADHEIDKEWVERQLEGLEEQTRTS